jgi:response regulator RpfG family c-di-GMP phosphodiesterase
LILNILLQKSSQLDEIFNIVQKISFDLHNIDINIFYTDSKSKFSNYLDSLFIDLIICDYDFLSISDNTPVFLLSEIHDYNNILPNIEGIGSFSNSLSEIQFKLSKLLTRLFLIKENINLNTRISQLQDSKHDDAIKLISDITKHKDSETSEHVKRVGAYSYLIAKKYNLNIHDLNLIEIASQLHDVGKTGIPDSVLKKKGKLTSDEFNIMKTHTSIGFDILSGYNSALFNMSAIICQSHHEKWDGSGYPLGLSKNNIPLVGRIVALADVFDALTNKRCYKDTWSNDDAFYFIKNQSGLHFDPDLVSLFLDSKSEIINIQSSIRKIEEDIFF